MKLWYKKSTEICFKAQYLFDRDNLNFDKKCLFKSKNLLGTYDSKNNNSYYKF